VGIDEKYMLAAQTGRRNSSTTFYSHIPHMIHEDKHAVQQHVYQHTSINNQDFDMYKSVKELSITTKF
jgi:hypothetical protein